LFLLLAACSNKPGLSASEKNYFRNMSEAHTELAMLDSLSQSNKFAKARYQEAVSQMKPKTKILLLRFKGTEYEKYDSYKATVDAFQSYLTAEDMWEQNKGLVLVNKRLAEGNGSLKKAQELIKQEQSR